MEWTQPTAILNPNESTKKKREVREELAMVAVVSDHPFTGNSHTDL